MQSLSGVKHPTDRAFQLSAGLTKGDLMKRSASEMVWRVLLVIAIIAVVHLVARILYVLWGMGGAVEVSHGDGIPAPAFAGRTIWNYPGTSGWSGDTLFFSHFLAIIICLILGLIAYGIYGMIHWIMYKPEEPVCTKPNCKCACHEGEYFDDETGTWIMLAAVSSAVAASAAASASVSASSS